MQEGVCRDLASSRWHYKRNSLLVARILSDMTFSANIRSIGRKYQSSLAAPNGSGLL